MALTAPIFPEQANPRVFALPPGVDFPSELVRGLAGRVADHPPEQIARVELIVNTTRMRRRLRMLYAEAGAGFLPRIRLLTEIGPASRPTPSKLTRRLELSQLVRRLLDREPDLAPRASVFDLSASLQRLLDEIEGEGVPLAALAEIDVGALSAHWARALTFINIIAPFLSGPESSGPEAAQRDRVLQLIASWADQPPRHPVLLAGSTGSRGTTALLMDAIAHLPQGAVILPGFDFDQPARIWSTLEDALHSEDHPQYRFASLLKRLDLPPNEIPRWTGAVAPAPARNELVSLALRPAPVTDQWLTEGPDLRDVSAACQDMTLIEAPSQRLEALAIALRLRKAAEKGKSAALITPDRVLARQVTAALDRWRIEPDDSAGQPLALSPPGRLLRQVAQVLGAALRADDLIALLKHPLTHSSPASRGPHLLLTRDLELHLRKNRIALPDPAGLRAWAKAQKTPEASEWGAWISELVDEMSLVCGAELEEIHASHRALCERLASGAGSSGAGALWDMTAGAEARKAMDALAEAAPAGGTVTLGEYRALFDSHLSEGEVRDPVRAHPKIMIWGTLEARVQATDLAILAGLNDGIWPPMPAADPWMSRTMRAQAGLLLPERQIGLSAHDFQQAIAASEVILSRAIRDEEAETVPSRWLNRLTNLLSGLNEDSKAELKEMRKRGTELLAEAERLDLPDAKLKPAARPSPRPPEAARPKELPVTSIERLVRNPYEIYARRILRLRHLPLLGEGPDARDRGNVLHKVMEKFVPAVLAGKHPLTPEALCEISAKVIAATDFPPDVTAFWQAHVARIAPELIAKEEPRLALAAQILTEQIGHRDTAAGFRLTCRADRFDIGHDGKLRIYDYKSTPPSKKQLKVFDFQLHLEAAIAEGGGIKGLGPQEVSALAYISLGTSGKDLEVALTPSEAEEIWDKFCDLIGHWQHRSAGYTARRMMKTTDEASDFDHLSRHGEWEITETAVPENVG